MRMNDAPGTPKNWKVNHSLLCMPPPGRKPPTLNPPREHKDTATSRVHQGCAAKFLSASFPDRSEEEKAWHGLNGLRSCSWQKWSALMQQKSQM